MLEEETYCLLLREVSFIEIEATRRYSLDEVDESGASASVAVLSPEERLTVNGRFISAFVRASKTGSVVFREIQEAAMKTHHSCLINLPGTFLTQISFTKEISAADEVTKQT